uniref:S1-like domain-containing protein n=1 Tax=Bionectria ochroleuca TaxID=29856 RepID=A0A8H7TUV6_BIOOC
MPKNKGKGGKNRRRGTKENDDQRRELTFKEDGQEYAQVIRGKMRKKVWINQGDIILLSLRDFQDNKGDVILKYTADEARTLKSYGELPENAKINETDTFGQAEGDEAGFEFGDADSEEESDADVPGGKKEVDIDDI